MAHQQPHMCSCFGGYCWKQFCAERTVNKELVKLQKREVTPLSTAGNTNEHAVRRGKKAPQISVFREGVNHDGPTLSPGRLPVKK